MNELKKYRKDNALTQKELARLMGVTPDHLSKAEKYKALTPSLKLRLIMVIQQNALKQIRALSTEQIIRNLAAEALGELK